MRPIRALATALALLASGCGTVCNLVRGFDHPDSEPRVYGGVALDMDAIGKVANSAPAESEVDNPRTWAVLLAMGAVDPVFSFVGDTLTLPITIPLQCKRQATAARKNLAAEAAPLTASPQATSTPRLEKLPDAQSGDGSHP